VFLIGLGCVVSVKTLAFLPLGGDPKLVMCNFFDTKGSNGQNQRGGTRTGSELYVIYTTLHSFVDIYT
jgi:hypothetical protein